MNQEGGCETFLLWHGFWFRWFADIASASALQNKSTSCEGEAENKLLGSFEQWRFLCSMVSLHLRTSEKTEKELTMRILVPRVFCRFLCFCQVRFTCSQASHARAPLWQTFCGLCRGWDCSVLLVLQTVLPWIQQFLLVSQCDIQSLNFHLKDPHEPSRCVTKKGQHKSSFNPQEQDVKVPQATNELFWICVTLWLCSVLGIASLFGVLMNGFAGKTPVNLFFQGRLEGQRGWFADVQVSGSWMHRKLTGS